MSKYSLILSSKVSTKTKIKVFELCINEVSVLDSFIEELEKDGNFETDLYGAISNLELAANLVTLHKTKFREIKGQKINGKLFEAKKGAVRIYHFHEKNTGRIIVLGGFKTDQTKDIKAAVKTIKSYQNERK